MSKKIIKLLNYKKNELKAEEIKLSISIQEQEKDLIQLDKEKDSLKQSADFLLSTDVILLKSAASDYYSSALENNVASSKKLDTRIDKLNVCIKQKQIELERNSTKSKAVKRHVESVNENLLESNKYAVQNIQYSELLEQILYETN